MNDSKSRNILVVCIAIIYTVGVIGSILPRTRDLTVSLTPINLIVSVILLTLGHSHEKKSFLAFLIISFVIGFGIEIIGVQTGMIFGQYEYGKTLGLKVLDVPVIIGLNWFLLSYIFGDLVSGINIPPVLKPMLAALLMVLMDLLIEPIAIWLDYWHWEGGRIPIQNYVAWFFVALVIQLIFMSKKIGSGNRASIPLLIAQLIYFGSLHLCMNFS